MGLVLFPIYYKYFKDIKIHAERRYFLKVCIHPNQIQNALPFVQNHNSIICPRIYYLRITKKSFFSDTSAFNFFYEIICISQRLRSVKAVKKVTLWKNIKSRNYQMTSINSKIHASCQDLILKKKMPRFIYFPKS